MCSLIVLRGLDRAYPLFVAANRDERTDRPSSPPKAWRGQRRQLLSPRDDRAGGTWLAVDRAGRVAAVTNVAGAPAVPGAPSRGHLPHLALDHDDLEAGVEAVLGHVEETPHAGFQLLVAAADRAWVVRYVDGVAACEEPTASTLALTNEHALGAWSPRSLAGALAPDLGRDARLERLAECLRDRGGDGHHAVCKHGDSYGTVSSSLIALSRLGRGPSIWRYAAGPPDVTAYRSYEISPARRDG
ncbi:MAG: NRDE family protein [Planctomycetota bacterium]|nr:NRDE family protein [Planctomycetota bacterium]